MTEPINARPLSMRQLFLTGLYLLVFPALLFVLSGDWHWPEAWIFTFIYIGLCVANVIYLYFNDPALLRERYRGAFQKEQKAWDKILLSIFVTLYFLSFVVMPLDAGRYHWSPQFPFWLETGGTVLLIAAFLVIFEVFRENTFAAPVVKIQEERHQRVISTGLYGIVRHPMYLGATMLFIGVPLLLGSLYGLAFGVMMTAIIAIRSIGEESMLRQELPGYQDYARRVRWRLVPFVF
jgi:protein-S-isoprenylcysteine O-methyltransferase Ste14